MFFGRVVEIKVWPPSGPISLTTEQQRPRGFVESATLPVTNMAKGLEFRTVAVSGVVRQR